MSNQINASIKPSGGSLGFSFNLNSSCSGNISWAESGTSQSISWFNVQIDEGKTGTITVSCGNNPGPNNYEMVIVPKVNGSDCPGIKVTQGYVNCACSSITLVQMAVIESGGTSAGTEVGTYTLDPNCDDSDVSFTSTDGITLTHSNGKIYLGTAIGEWDYDTERLFHIKYYYDGQYCDEVVLVQLGQEPCDCTTQVDYAIHTFRRTFKDSGTTTSTSPVAYNEEEIASGHSYCGKISASTYGACGMLYDSYPKTVYTQSTGDFSFKVAVKPRTSSDGRSCTINFHFKKGGLDDYGTYAPCSAYMVIEQQGDYCRCSNLSSMTFSYFNGGPDNYRWAQENTNPAYMDKTGCYNQTAFYLQIRGNGGNSCNGCNCLTSKIIGCNPEGALYYDGYNSNDSRQFFELTNNPSIGARNITAKLQVLADASDGNPNGTNGEICYEENISLTQEGLPNCDCPTATAEENIIWYNYASYGYLPVNEGQNVYIESDSVPVYYDRSFFFRSTCYDYYEEYDADSAPYGRWNIDTTNTASWLTLQYVRSSCSGSYGNIGMIQYGMETNPYTDERTTTFDLVYHNRQSGRTCRRTVTVHQAASSGPPQPFECSCSNSLRVSGRRFNAQGTGGVRAEILYIRTDSRCQISNIQYSFDGGQPSWITSVVLSATTDGYSLMGIVATGSTTESRSQRVHVTWDWDGHSCSDYGDIYESKAEPCGCGYLSLSTLNGQDTMFTSAGTNNQQVTFGALYFDWNENMVDRSCISVNVTLQGTSNLVTLISSTTPKDGSPKYIYGKVAANTTGQPQTIAINVNIKNGTDQCFFGDIILKISGDDNYPT